MVELFFIYQTSELTIYIYKYSVFPYWIELVDDDDDDDIQAQLIRLIETIV